MKRFFVGLVLLTAALAVVWISQPRSQSEDAKEVSWSVKADYTDACCCQPTCPCLFGSAPTLGFCEGVTLIEFEKANYGNVKLDGVNVAAVYRGGTWIKFYVGDNADAQQTEAAVALLPTFEKFFAIENVVEVKNVPLGVEQSGDTRKITTPNTTVEIKVMKGKNGKPISIDNLPWPGFPAPPLMDHMQYQTVVLKHEGGDQKFEHSGTNGFTAKITADSDSSH